MDGYRQIKFRACIPRYESGFRSISSCSLVLAALESCSKVLSTTGIYIFHDE
jgi:hypothetical protein